MFIDHLRGEAAAHDALRRATATGDWLAASVLTKVEVLAGMRASEEGATRLLLDSLDWIEVDDEFSPRACDFWPASVCSSHAGVDPVDYVIAAPVERLEARLWARNVRRLPRCLRSSNLRIET